MSARVRFGVLLLLGLSATARSTAAQTLPIKVFPPAPEPGACPEVPAQAAAHGASKALLDSLLTAGSRAAILGDHAAAEELLRRAAGLDPLDAVVSYRLARTLDDQGQQGGAALEYCRYLALAPDAPDAEEVRGRARELLLNGRRESREAWRVEAGEGMLAFEGGRYEEAAAAFTRVLDLRPDYADAHYNRAVARMQAGRSEEAAADLDAYLRLTPAADDATRVREALDRLRAPAPVVAEPPAQPLRRAAPGRVLAQGLVVPGLGQHTTGRTVLGVGVLAAVGGAVYFALQEQVVVRTLEGQDPFGNRYEYDVRTLERRHQALGFGAAAAIGIGAALESFLYARRQPRAQGAVATSATATTRRAFAFSVAPSMDGLRVGVRIPAGSGQRARPSRAMNR